LSLFILFSLGACQVKETSSVDQTEIIEETPANIPTPTFTLTPTLTPSPTITLTSTPTETPTSSETPTPIHVFNSIDETVSFNTLYYRYSVPGKGFVDESENRGYNFFSYTGAVVSYELNYNGDETYLYVLLVSARGIIRAKIDFVQSSFMPPARIMVNNSSEKEIEKIKSGIDNYFRVINQERDFQVDQFGRDFSLMWYGFPRDGGVKFCEGLIECPFDSTKDAPNHNFMYDKFTQLILPCSSLSTSKILRRQDYPMFSSDENTLIALDLPFNLAETSNDNLE